jgi:hypothetical protein
MHAPASPPGPELRSRSYAVANSVASQLMGATSSAKRSTDALNKTPINRVASSGLLFEMDV